MPYQISFRSLSGVPVPTVKRLEARLAELAETLSAIPPSSIFWASLVESRLFIDLDGWRFMYAVDPVEESLTVENAARLTDVAREQARARADRKLFG